MAIRSEKQGSITIVTIDRAEARNAIDRPHAEDLARAFRDFDADPSQRVAVLTGAGASFCAGADLKAIGSDRMNRVARDGDGPMGPTRMRLEKPVIAAIEGPAVAGGLELACWCDLRVAGEGATLGVLCRRWGVPLIDGGTVRLPRLIGESRALDLVLTGRAIDAREAHAMGLVNRVVAAGDALAAAIALAQEIAAFPQECMRNDRASVLDGHALDLDAALARELEHGERSLASPELGEAVGRFVAGAGRHGSRA